MANVVEIVVKGPDQTNPGMQRAITNTQSLGKEMKGLGSVMNATGNIAGTLGNQAFASLANQATMLAFAGKEVIQVFTKMNVVKASIVGLALAGGAAIVGQIMKERDERKKAEEDLKQYGVLFEKLIDRFNEMGNVEAFVLLKERDHHIERIRMVQELAVDQDAKNRYIKESYLLMEKEQTRIAAEQEKRRAEIAEVEKKKKLAAQQQYHQGTVTIFGNLAAAAEAFGKKGFRAFQAFRIAEAIASTYAGAARALADYPWPFSIAVAASVVAAGIANVAQIASAKPQAHSGLDYVPQEATYKLQRGEMVLDPGTSEEVRQAARGGAGAGGGNYAVNIYLDGDVIARALKRMSNDGRLNISARAIT